MKAFAIDRYRGGLTARDVPDPVPGPGDVVVQIMAAGVNPLDLRLRDGAFKAFLPYRLPLILGNDLAGVVVAAGPGARRFKTGDEVYARPRAERIGAFAERIAIAEADLALKPASLSMTDAAALPLVALTAWQALVERAQVKPGQKVLIQAGSGGVGTVAIQLAKHLGATVATTCGADNVDLVRSLGADVAIDYRKEDFAERLSGYDVVLHSQGPEMIGKSLSVLKPGGRLISLSGPPDPAFAREIGGNLIIRLLMRLLSSKTRRQARKLGVDYSFLFMRADGAQLAEIARLVDAGVIQPVIDSVFDFDETPVAMQRVESGRARGKVVIRMSPDPSEVRSAPE